MAQHTPRYHQVEVHPKNLDPLRINYVEAGNPEKPTILLLHGFPSSTSQFRNFIPLLSKEYHVLAPDLPGFGLTTYPATFPFTFDIFFANSLNSVPSGRPVFASTSND